MADLLSPLGRLCFPVLTERAMERQGNDRKTYNICLLLNPNDFSPKDKERYRALVAAVKDAAVAKFGKSCLDENGKLVEGYDNPFHKAAAKVGKYQGFEAGMIYLNAKTEIRPGIADARNGRQNDGTFPEVEDVSEAYPGCYVRVKLQPFAYDTKRRGVGIGLGNIIIIKDGERLDNTVEAGSDFSDMDDDELEFTAPSNGGDDDLI